MLNQLELSIGARPRRSGNLQRHARRQRAQWWFARMRQTVDAALEWRPSPPARPEQVYLNLAAAGSRLKAQVSK